MTEKELRRLNRQDLLQLLLLQSREMESLQAEADQLRRRCDALASSAEELKEKLDRKEATIEQLIARLEEKDETIGRMQATALDEQAVVELAVRAAGDYLTGRKA